MIDRRSFLQIALAAQAFAALPARASTPGLHMGEPQPFSYDWLKSHAQALAGSGLQPAAPARPQNRFLHRLRRARPDSLQAGIRAFRRRRSGRLPDHLHACGAVFPQDRAHVRHRAGAGARRCAREILYDPSYFSIPPGNVAAQLPANPSPMAGFWVREPKAGTEDWRKAEPWVAFLGASYFRAKGELGQVGMSASGDRARRPGGSSPEEFPDFVAFWFDARPAGVEIGHGLRAARRPEASPAPTASSWSAPRAWSWRSRPALFFRQAVERLGLAPLTSMYWYSETVKRAGDGLAAGSARFRRPCDVDRRRRAHLAAAQQSRRISPSRPSRTSIRAASGFCSATAISTIISTAWLREAAFQPGSSPWAIGARAPSSSSKSPPTTRSTTTSPPIGCPRAAGRGRQPRRALATACIGWRTSPIRRRSAAASRRASAAAASPASRAPTGVRKFEVEFLGGPLAQLPYGVKPELVLWSSRGEFTYTYAEAVPDDVPGHWRALFDLTVEGNEPVEMRLYLKAGARC